jgi:hypothetical protein
MKKLKLLLPLFSVMLAVSCTCNRISEDEGSATQVESTNTGSDNGFHVVYENNPTVDSILAEIYASGAEISRTKFVPSAFTKNAKLQEELLKFIYKKQWKLDERILIYQGNPDYADFFNFDKIEDKIPPLNLQCDNEVLRPASVFENKNAVYEELGGELWNSFVDSLSPVLSNSSNKQLTTTTYLLRKKTDRVHSATSAKLSEYIARPSKKEPDSEYTTSVYLCGRVRFNVDSGIESYVVIVEQTANNNTLPYSSEMFLITQNAEQVLSILKLNNDSNDGLSAFSSRTIRLDSNIIVLQFEGGATDIVIEVAEGEELGWTNDASFYVYEVLPNGFIKALK